MADRVSKQAIFADGITINISALKAGDNKETAVGRNGATSDPTSFDGLGLGEGKRTAVLVYGKNADCVGSVEHIINPFSAGVDHKALLLKGHKSIGRYIHGFSMEILAGFGSFLRGDIIGKRADDIYGSQLAALVIAEGCNVHAAFVVMEEERLGGVEGTVAGRAAGFLGIRLADKNKPLVFVV